MKIGVGRLSLFVFVFCAVLSPTFSYAQIANFVFVSDPQTIQPGIPSQQISIQAQDSAGASINIPSTACVSLTSTSAQGQFSSNATNWSPIFVLTMSKNTANKNFYYQDSQAGSPTLSVKVSLKPDTVSSSCASWPIDEWNVQWTAIQSITVGSGGTSSTSNTSTTSSDTISPTQTQTQTSAPVSSYVAPPAPSVFADAGSDRTVIVGADTEFDGRAYNKNQVLMDHVRFLWNFGDGSIAEGPAVLHRYNYPGRYAVVLDIAEDKSAASDRIIVTAEPAKIAFKTLSDSGVEIENLAGRDLDLSGWLIRESIGLMPGLFKLPEHSVILSGSSMRISKATLGFSAGPHTQLQYPNGVAVLQVGERTADTSTTASAASVSATTLSVSRTPASVAASAGDTSVRAQEEIVNNVPEDIATTTDMHTAAAGSIFSGWNVWWVAVVVLSLISAGGLIVAQYFSKSEWDIIEEKPEAE